MPLSRTGECHLGLTWDGKYYVERCLSFGLRTAPIIFNLFSEALEWILLYYTDCSTILHYLDNFIMIMPQLLRHLILGVREVWVHVTNSLRMERQDDKDDKGTVVTVLGIKFDTNNLVARLLKKKLEKLRFRVERILLKEYLFALDLDRLTGYLLWCAAVIALGRSYISSLWDLRTQMKLVKGPRRLSATVKSDLRWWLRLAERYNGLSFKEGLNPVFLCFSPGPREIFHLFTDACNIGMGGFWYASGSHSWHAASFPMNNAFAIAHADHLACEHINAHELRAVLLTLSV